MKLAVLLTVVAVLPAQADFSYRTTLKSEGAIASVVGDRPPVGTFYYKGRKVKIDSGATATLLDLGARTVTTLDNVAKTARVRSMDDPAWAADPNIEVKVDVKETGAKRVVNGFNASEAVLTTEIQSPPERQMGNMQLEMDLWLSTEVPGADEQKAFHEKNAAGFPWAALAGGGTAPMQAAMAEAMRKIAALNGVPVQRVMRIRAPGVSLMNAPGVTSAEAAQMEAAMAQVRERLETARAQGGQSEQVDRILSQLGGGPGGRGSAALVEITVDSSDFSIAPIPDSIFDIPGDYQIIN